LPVTVVSPLTIRFAVTVLLTLAERAVRVETLPVSVLLIKTLRVVTFAARDVSVDTFPVTTLADMTFKVVTF